MNNYLKTLIEYIKLPVDIKAYLENGSLDKIICSEEENTFTFLFNFESTLPITVYFEFVNYLRDFMVKDNIDNVEINIHVEKKNYLDDYYKYFLDQMEQENFFIQSLKEITPNLENNVITLNVDSILLSNKIEEIKEDLLKFLEKCGFGKLSLASNIIHRENEEVRHLIEESLKIDDIPSANVCSSDIEEPVKKVYQYERKPRITEDKPNVIYGREITDEQTMIKNINSASNNLTIEAYVFADIDIRETKTDLKIITLKVTDYTDSMYAKIFVNTDEELTKIKSSIKKNRWYLLRGNVKDDNYSKELTFMIRDINVLQKETSNLLVDDAKIKRVELHAHTMMSQMDGLTRVDLGEHTCELVSRAIEMGYRAVAITDHNGCQAFPIAYSLITKHNKKIEDPKNYFKGLYGTELTLVDDTVNIVVRPTDLLLKESTFVVFDTETTGFNAGGADQMIEIGAVKICNGEIIDRFDELIDPNRPLPQKIVDLTCITDDMLKGKRSEKEVTKSFLEWIEDLPMVAHNAKFDISFIEAAMNKYDLGNFKNTVIDTLELSRALDQGYARHSLSALVKRYNVPWEEDAHHRADYDAEGTAIVFYKMCQKLTSQKLAKISDLEKLVPKDEIYKFGRTYHFNAIAKNKTGLKNLFKIISLANTVYLYKTPRILRSKLNELREGLLIGSGCYESEVFLEARSKEGQELTNIINFYDYVEVQPPEVYDHLIQTSDFGSVMELQNHIRKIVEATKSSGKIIVATGDVHHFTREDKIYREIIINQKVPGGGRHPLAKSSITDIPSMHFRTTDEMLNDFSFLGKELAYEIVVENTNKVVDMVDVIEVIIDTNGIPFSPRVKSDDGLSYLDCPRVVTDLVYEKASAWYGENLPYNIEERIAKELYGDIVYRCYYDTLKDEKPDITDDELEKQIFANVHKTILSGFDTVKSVLKDYLKSKWQEEDGELIEASLDKKLKKELGGIIGGGFDPIYLIAQRLVKHSNDDGYLVGSRGSVGSSFVATMMGITEVNPLPAHYRCLSCKTSIFNDDNGNPLGATYSSGFDLPDKICPNCGNKMYKDGQDMPFATFLGFNADKVPDIDLNFSDLNQASAHEYTKVLFGVDNVYRAGTIGTVADKTAFGFVKGYCEDKGITKRTAEIERLAIGCTGVKRTTGQHPGGIVVVPDYMEVSDFTPFQFPADDVTSPWRTTHFDYHAIDQDLLKLDILGHSDPTQLRMIQDLTKMDILTVPLDDKETMSIFTSTKALGVTNEQIMCPTGTLGIPEFGTQFTISMVAETKPTTFAELIKISGLSHGTDVWLGNAQELIKNNIVPFKEVIGCRDDIMVYLMYHGVKPIKAFKIMEFVRKGKASKEPDAWKEHKQTMIDAGIEDWFINSCEKIKYMFPKAHAAAYVISAFRIAWYKVHMPVYFYASWLTSKATAVDVEVMIDGYDAIRNKIIEIEGKGYEATNKELGQLESLKVCLEATARGIKFLPIDLSSSLATVWGVKDDTSIYPPFSSIDGLGDTVAKNIVEEREKGEFISIEDLAKRAKISQTLIDKLRIMKILDGMAESSQLSLF